MANLTLSIAERMDRLGTETAFAVSAQAAAHAAQGNRVFPFHLGDMNLKTPENIIEAAHRAMQDGKTGYCSNFGIATLREALAEEINRTHGTHYDADQVAIQPGGKPVISKFLQVLMNPGDEVLYPNPGFPIYESQIEFLGGHAVPYSYQPGKENFKLKLDDLEKSITPKTRLLIFNDLQNPTGAEATPEELQQLAQLVEKHDLLVLNDEAYFDIRFDGISQALVSLPGMIERCVILYTFSKKFAMTGWRLGAAIGPKEIIELIGKLNVNIESCSNHFIQHAAVEALQGDSSGTDEILRILKKRRDQAVDGLTAIQGIQCYRPNATFYLFPNVTPVLERVGVTSLEDFRLKVLEKTGVAFCTRNHFGRSLPGETEHYIRFAYSGIDVEMIEEGLEKMKCFIES